MPESAATARLKTSTVTPISRRRRTYTTPPNDVHTRRVFPAPDCRGQDRPSGFERVVQFVVGCSAVLDDDGVDDPDTADVGVFELRGGRRPAVLFGDIDQLVQQRDAATVVGEHREISCRQGRFEIRSDGAAPW